MKPVKHRRCVHFFQNVKEYQGQSVHFIHFIPLFHYQSAPHSDLQPHSHPVPSEAPGAWNAAVTLPPQRLCCLPLQPWGDHTEPPSHLTHVNHNHQISLLMLLMKLIKLLIKLLKLIKLLIKLLKLMMMMTMMMMMPGFSYVVYILLCSEWFSLISELLCISCSSICNAQSLAPSGALRGHGLLHLMPFRLCKLPAILQLTMGCNML